MALSVPIELNDMMSGPLTKICSALDTVINSMGRVGSVSDSAFKSAQGDIRSANAQLTTMQTELKGTNSNMSNVTGKTNGFKSSLKGIAGAVGGLYAVQKAFSLISNSVESAMNRTQQETKLATIMGQRMGTNNIKGVTGLMSSQSQTGVIGTTTQMQGAQQMGTFLSQEKSLKTLIPAMNNLAVQQKGVNATGDDMKNIGNMIGKVMQGQTGALKRVGISFTSAQEKAIKYGSETQRAAALAQVITSNVGNMNKAIAKTPQGQMAQLKNKMNGVKLSIGQGVVPALANMNKVLGKKSNLAVIQNMATVFSALTSGVIKGMTSVAGAISTVIGKVGKIFGLSGGFKNLSNAAATLTKIILTLGGAYAVYRGILAVTNTLQAISAARALLANHVTIAEAAGTTLASGAQIGFNAALLACPLTWIVIGIAAVIAVIVILQKKTHFLNAAWGKLKKVGHSMASGLTSAFGKIHKAFSAAGKKISIAGRGIKKVFTGIMSFVIGTFYKGWTHSWKLVVKVFGKIWSGIRTVAKAPINFMIGMINKLINGLNKISFKFPSWVPKVGGKSFGINIAPIPQLAKGTKNFQGGGAIVGEHGPEYLEMPRGSKVHTAAETRGLGSKKIIVNKLADTIVVREEADIDKIASRMADKLEQIELDVVPA